MINFDKAATNEPSTTVIHKVLPYLTNLYGNPNSTYTLGRESRIAIDNSRNIVAKYINANTDNIIFTSSSSASNTLAMRGFIDNNINTDLIVSRIEHIDILDCAQFISSSSLYNSDLYMLDVDQNGIILLEQLETYCSKIKNKNKQPFVIIQLVNNEIGTYNDIKAISKIVHKYGGILHVDATQAITKIPIDVIELGIDMLSFGGHKIHALRGTGVLYKNNNISLAPLVFGHQEQGLFAGTENTASIVSIAESLKLPNHIDYITELRDYFESEIIRLIPDIHINGKEQRRIPCISNICFLNCDATQLQSLLDCDGIFVSSGSACNSTSTTPSHVLSSLGLDVDIAFSCLRFSFDSQNTKEEIDIVIRKLIQHTAMLRLVNTN